MKRDTDQTDFRNNMAKYERRDGSCLFCNLSTERIVHQNNLAWVIADKYPVTEGHHLIIPKRHSGTFFELNQAELNALNQLTEWCRKAINKQYPEVGGFNLGFNAGEVAGQTIMHTHLHVIPRRAGDVPLPRGGIRNVIPGKGDY